MILLRVEEPCLAVLAPRIRIIANTYYSRSWGLLATDSALDQHFHILEVW